MYPLAMRLIDGLLIVCDRYCRLAGIRRGTLSTRLFGRGTKLDDLVAGGDLNTGTFERAMQWFSDHWPKGAAWPDEIPRPPASPDVSGRADHHDGAGEAGGQRNCVGGSFGEAGRR